MTQRFDQVPNCLPDARDRIAARCPDLDRMLRSIGFPPDIVPDAVQNAVLRALIWVESGKFSKIRNENAWLRTVAVRTALTLLGRQSFSTLQTCPEPEIDPVEDLDRMEKIRSQRAKLDAAIGRLPEEMRDTFIFCRVEGNSCSDAALKYGCSKDVIRGRLNRARAALRLDLGIKTTKKTRTESL